jgi:hypothetical protein
LIEAAEVDLHLADGEYSLSARFNVSLPVSIATSPNFRSRKPSLSVLEGNARQCRRCDQFGLMAWRAGTCHDSGHITAATAARATGSWCQEAHAKQNEVY